MSRLYRVRIPVLAMLASLVVAIAVTAMVAWWFKPTVLRMGLEAGSPATAILNRFVDAARRERASMQLEGLEVASSAERARQLEARQLDLAVFRLDEPLPRRASAVGLFEGDAVIAVARPRASVTKISELGGKRVAVAVGHPADEELVRSVFQNYRVEPVVTVYTNDALARAEYDAGRTDVLVVVGRPDGMRVRTLFGAISDRGGAPVFLPIDASVVKTTEPHVETLAISASLVDPRRSLPAEEVTTIAVKRALLASNDLSNSTMAAFTRFLFDRRDQLSATFPLMAALQPPSTTRGSTLPTHPGAAEYIDATEMSFLTRYSDLIYIALCFTGVFGSMWAAIYTKYRFSSRHGLTRLISGIATAGKRAASTQDQTALCTLERQAADHVLEAALNPRFAADEKALGLLEFTFSAARVAIDARRRELEKPSGPVPEAERPPIELADGDTGLRAPVLSVVRPA